MAKRGENDIPNFETGWRFSDMFYWMAIGPGGKDIGNKVHIGYTKIYLNTSTGVMGFEYFNLHNQALFKIWEKEVKCENEQRKLNYISYRTKDGKKKVFRIKSLEVTVEISEAKVNSITTATVSFELVTGRKEMFMVELK